MKVEGFNICKTVAEQQSLDYDLLKSINDACFKELSDKFKAAEKLIIKIHGFGNFFFKKTKTSEKLRNLNTFGKGLHSDYEGDLRKLNHILDLYKVYSQERLELKYEKYGKENYEAYCLAKKKEKISRKESNQS